MEIKNNFTEALDEHKRLFALWFATVTVLLASHQLLAVSFVLSTALFFVGAMLLSFAGVSCAYAVVRESQ